MAENPDGSKQPKLGWDIFRHDSDLRFSGNANNNGANTENIVELDPKEREEKIAQLFQTSTERSPKLQKRSPRNTSASASFRNVGTPLHGNLTVTNQEVASDESSFNFGEKSLRSIFTIDKVSCDVVLDNDCIKWTPVDSSKKRPGSGFGSRRPSFVEKSVLYLPELYAVKLKTLHNMKTSNRSTLGFTVFYTSEAGDGRLREESIFFECFSRNICVEWGRRIKGYIDAFKCRPGNVLVLMKPTKECTTVWNDQLKPLLINAAVSFDLVSMKQKGFFENYISHKMNEVEDKKFDAFVVVGKLKLFSEVFNGYITSLNHRDTLSNHNGSPSNTPPTLAYIPSTHNCQVAGMLYGCSDALTAMMHVVYGNKQDIYPCMFEHADPQHHFGLSASYGFYGGDTVKRKSFNKSFALTKALMQRRAYLCDVAYKTSDGLESIQSDDFMFANGSTEEHDWSELQRRGYIDVTVSTLPGLMKPHELSRKQVFARLLSGSISRRDLTSKASMGSIRSLREKMTSATSVVNDYDVVDGDEVIVMPTDEIGYQGNNTNTSGTLSSWSIDGHPLAHTAQRLHAKVATFSVSMFCCPDKSLFRPLTPGERTVMNNRILNSDESDV